MKAIDAACPKCHRPFPVYLPSSGKAWFAVTNCDHCGHECSVRSCIHELEKQRQAPLIEERKRREQEASARRRAEREEGRHKERIAKQNRKAAERDLQIQRVQVRKMQEQQEQADNWKRLNIGAGCPRCGSIRSTVIRKTTTAGWIVLLVGLVFTPFCFGVILIVISCFLNEQKLRCDKCHFVRSR